MLKTPAIMASGISTLFSPENPNEHCDKLKFIIQQNQPEAIRTQLKKKPLP